MAEIKSVEFSEHGSLNHESSEIVQNAVSYAKPLLTFSLSISYNYHKQKPSFHSKWKLRFKILTIHEDLIPGQLKVSDFQL